MSSDVMSDASDAVSSSLPSSQSSSSSSSSQSLSSSSSSSLSLGDCMVSSDDDAGVVSMLRQQQSMSLFWLIQRRARRRQRCVYMQLDFPDYARKMEGNPELKNEIWLSIHSFYKLLGLIEEDLKVDGTKACSRRGPILPDLCLYMTLRYLAGSDIPAIKNFTGVSRAAAYHAVGRTIKAIVHCKPLAPHFPRTKEECASAALEFRSIS
jgi:hypothetical protein